MALDYTINHARVLAEARDAVTGDSASSFPTASQLNLKIEAEERRIFLQAPALLLSDGVTLVASLTQGELQDIHRGIGCAAAASFLSTPAGRRFAGATQIKIGPVTKTLAEVGIDDLIEECRNLSAQAYRRVGIIGLGIGSTQMSGRAGNSVEHPHPPRTIFDQAFGRGRSDEFGGYPIGGNVTSAYPGPGSYDEGEYFGDRIDGETGWDPE